jgi:hypothetical protein
VKNLTKLLASAFEKIKIRHYVKFIDIIPLLQQAVAAGYRGRLSRLPADEE